MSTAFNFLIMLLLTMPSAVVLPIYIGVGGWGWPMNSRVWQVGMASLQLMYRAPTSASATKDMTALIICAIVRMAPLFGGLAVLLDMNKCPPAQLRAFDLEGMMHHCVLQIICHLRGT